MTQPPDTIEAALAEQWDRESDEYPLVDRLDEGWLTDELEPVEPAPEARPSGAAGEASRP